VACSCSGVNVTVELHLRDQVSSCGCTVNTPGRAGGLIGTPRMKDSLEVRVLYPT
jgi:hypothetical protein